MKKKLVFSALLGGSVLLIPEEGFAHTKYVVVEETVPGAPVMVEQEPPALIVEDRGVAPGPAYVWINGYWKWDKHWKWSKGKWVLKPSAEAVWVPGCWEKKHHHWVWKEGHWQ